MSRWKKIVYLATLALAPMLSPFLSQAKEKVLSPHEELMLLLDDINALEQAEAINDDSFQDIIATTKHTLPKKEASSEIRR